MGKHTMSDLYQMQSLPLKAKITMTERRIQEWVEEYGEDGVYVSFSGGKDSTVLLDIARRLYPNIKAAFVDTGLEYPEIRQFVKSFDNVDWLKPKMTFRQVIEKYGYPFISKEVSECVDGARKYLKILTDRQTDRQTDRHLIVTSMKELPERECMLRTSRWGTTTNIESLEALASILRQDLGKTQGSPYRVARMLKILTKDNQIQTDIPSNNRSMWSQAKYSFFLDAPFDISAKCCGAIKKDPLHKYFKQTNRKPITAQMASESRLRTQKWLQNGCNGFDLKYPISNPMSFWTEQDILLYIWQRNLPIASVYGEVIKDYEAMGQLDGQMDMSELAAEFGVFDVGRPTLRTTGCNRTGCMFCGYGCHRESSPNRFERMKETHPKQYDYIMRPWEEGGLNYKEVIDWINEHGNMNIKY